MISIHMTSPQKWITTVIIIILTIYPMNTMQMANNTVKPISMAPEPTQPMEMAPAIPLHPLPTISLKIMNNR